MTSNNHYFIVTIVTDDSPLQNDFVIRNARTSEEAVKKAMRRAVARGLSNPSPKSVSEHLLTPAQRPKLDS